MVLPRLGITIVGILYYWGLVISVLVLPWLVLSDHGITSYVECLGSLSGNTRFGNTSLVFTYYWPPLGAGI